YRHWLRELECVPVAEHPWAITGCPVEIQRTIDEEGRENVIVTDHLGLVIRNIDGEHVATAARFSDYSYGPFNLPYLAYQNRATVEDWQTPTFERTYDDYGRPTRILDIDTGITASTYNGYDELTTSLDAKQQLRTYAYDTLGRLVSVTDPSGVTQWIYDQGPNAIGRLTESITPGTAEYPAGQRVRYEYEPVTPGANRGLLQRLDHVIDGASYPVELEYDGLGRVQRVHYPNL